MAKYDAIAIGASAGGVEALRILVRGLPPALPAAVFVTLHTPAHSRSVLPELLRRGGPLPALHPNEGEIIRRGSIYVAPPNRHLIVRDGHVALSAGPKENGSRPAIDPLFRSAARAFGPRLIGVVLSGTLDDGAAGLAFVKSRGGLAIVQSPASALYPDMPRNAMAATDVDHVVAIEELGELLATLVGGPGEMVAYSEVPMTRKEPLEERIDTMIPPEAERGIDGTPSEFTCPDCGGVLNLGFDRGGNLGFRCQVGHAWSPHGLLAEQLEHVEESLWAALRVLQEHKRLTNRMLDNARQRNLHSLIDLYEQRVRDTEHHENRIRDLIKMPLPSLEPATSPAQPPPGGNGQDN